MLPVLVVGAGPTGLVLALWLTRLGVRVRVVDAAEGPADYSQALGVQARTLELYRQAGLAERVVEAGLRVTGVNLWTGGTRQAHVPLDPEGRAPTPYPFVLIYPQNEHERLLLDALSELGVHVEWKTELVGLDQGPDGVRATLRKNGRNETVEAAFLGGCDGAHSRVRETLGLDFSGGTYGDLFYVADVKVAGLPTADEIHVDLDRADLLAIFPLAEPGTARLVGTVVDVDEDELAFEDVARAPIEEMGLEVERVNWFSPYRVHHRVAARFRQGRVFLLGDAGHIHSPVGAQGMNTGIGDAVNLAWKLAAVLDGSAATALLDSYEPERLAFAQRLVATTDRVFTFAVRRGRLAATVRTRIFPEVMSGLTRLRWVRRNLFRLVSQIGLDYRDSPLSRGRAGDVHGGDRLPWVSAETGDDNFAPLTSLGWQIHTYGGAGAQTRAACRALEVPVHDFPWSTAAEAAGLLRGAVYLVRPDGYVGFAGEGGEEAALRDYVQGLRG